MLGAVRRLRVRRGWGWVAGVVALAVLVPIGFALFGGDGEESVSAAPDTRAREYRDVDACLLTGEDGIARGTVAATVWDGMQQASKETRARVTYVPVTGEQSADNARPFVNGLVQRQCDVVLAVGTPQVRAAEAAAGQHPSVPFVVVGGGEATRDNVTVVRPGEGLKSAVVKEVRGAMP
ncbi:BMP family ABC transporter substrate-binding protein [Streptomyces acidiscabies]|uniref:BMP family ABC transporter substrate-binding protein n=1 Tax=Streptomyces acidiscabies TaxID=42234 RepID=UPI0038F7D5D3